MTNKKLLATAVIAAVIAIGSITMTSASAGMITIPPNYPKGQPFQFIADALTTLQDQINTQQTQINSLQGKVGSGNPQSPTMWINYLGFLSGDSGTTVSYNAVNSGVGGGLAGLIVQSSTLGDTATGGGDKFISTGLQVPPGYNVTSATVCYDSSNGTRTYVDQLRISQLQSPPSTALVLLDSSLGAISGPSCVNTGSTLINPANGQLTLDLRINTGDTSDKIVIRGVALNLQHN